ncbi:MAG: hypothetical protein ACR2K5_07210, partial [Pseudolabrys sp.]
MSLAALAVAGCARRSAPVYTMIDPATGQQVQVVAPPNQPPAQQAVYAQAPVYAQQPYRAPQNFSLTQTYIPPQAPPPAAAPPPADSGRGLFHARRHTPVSTQPQL